MKRRGQAWLYPDRKRCLACRQYFGFLVVDGLYDSWECAGRERTGGNPEDWPREHYVPMPGGERREKRGYLHQQEAKTAAGIHHKDAYLCGYCKFWHIGTLNPTKER